MFVELLATFGVLALISVSVTLLTSLNGGFLPNLTDEIEEAKKYHCPYCTREMQMRESVNTIVDTDELTRRYDV